MDKVNNLAELLKESSSGVQVIIIISIVIFGIIIWKIVDIKRKK